ncbi:MAG: hypothetical protein ACRC76_09090 [Proteocatella sp.]
MDFLKDYNSISFIGMSKNAGKTTTLNYFIDKARGKYTLGLSSIGRDGETVDRVTSTEKPKIYIYKNTIIATCANCYKLSDATLEILEVTNINTPLGHILIVRAISDGYVEIAGPSTTSDMRYIIEAMKFWGAEKIFIDGALSRKSLASPTVAEATVLSTGASLSNDIGKVVRETVLSYELLNIDKLDNLKIIEIIKNLNSTNIIKDFTKRTGCLAIINNKDELVYSDCSTILGKESKIIDNIDLTTRYVYTSGAITDTFVESLLKNTTKKHRVSIIVDDGTKLFISEENKLRLKHRNIDLLAVDKINICAITVNPYSAQDYSMDSSILISRLQKDIELPIFDVKGV